MNQHFLEISFQHFSGLRIFHNYLVKSQVIGCINGNSLSKRTLNYIAVIHIRLSLTSVQWLNFGSMDQQQVDFWLNPSAIDSDSLKPLSVLHSKLKFQW